MNWRLQRCSVEEDRLSSLPDDLLGRILSLLRTKDAAATQVLSKRIAHAFSSSVTTLDLDESPVSHCLKHPHLVERFPLFESFVDNILNKFSRSKQPLTCFRLCLGGEDKSIRFRYYDNDWHICERQSCLPDLAPARIIGWISFPLAYCAALRELHLSFHVRNTDDCKPPQGLFTWQSLEVLTLDSNIVVGDGGYDAPPFFLPKVKVIRLYSLVFSEDDFVTNLVSSCPSLEDLLIRCMWLKSDRVEISSTSLRRLDIFFFKAVELKNSDLVLIDTPNLQYFRYTDNLAFSYSISDMNHLLKAYIDIRDLLAYKHIRGWDTAERCFLSQLSLIRALSNAHHLSLIGNVAGSMCFDGETSENQLPVFHNMKTLEMGAGYSDRWDIWLLLILHCSPLLETLVFPEGFYSGDDCADDDRFLELAALEAEGWRRIEERRIIPSCFITHLKRIKLTWCSGFSRDLNIIKYLLGKASVLEEFVISTTEELYAKSQGDDLANFDEFAIALEELPRASNSCSITLHRWP